MQVRKTTGLIERVSIGASEAAWRASEGGGRRWKGKCNDAQFIMMREELEVASRASKGAKRDALEAHL